MTENHSPNGKSQELVITRVFNAPRELVWKAWIESARLAQWWGPKGFKMMVAKLDLRPQGVFHYSMQAPNGPEMWGKFVFQEIVAPEKIVFINSFSDKDGGITPNPYMPNWPLEVMNTLTLEESNGKTTLTLRGGPINATELQAKTFEEGRPSMQQGFIGTWEQLDNYLAKNS